MSPPKRQPKLLDIEPERRIAKATPRARHLLKTCSLCGEDYLTSRSTSKYCSETCRYAGQYRARTEKAIKRRYEYQKKWNSENWLRRRNYSIKSTFGITSEQYQELLEKQNYSCAICNRHETEFSRKLAIDHNHITGEITGLLCNQCNHRLIGKQRNPDIFQRAADYLRQGTGWVVPERKKHAKRKRRK